MLLKMTIRLNIFLRCGGLRLAGANHWHMCPPTGLTVAANSHQDRRKAPSTPRPPPRSLRPEWARPFVTFIFSGTHFLSGREPCNPISLCLRTYLCLFPAPIRTEVIGVSIAHLRLSDYTPPGYQDTRIGAVGVVPLTGTLPCADPARSSDPLPGTHPIPIKVFFHYL